MKFGSVTCKLGLTESLHFEPRPTAQTGDVVVVEVLSENASYPHLELPNGTMSKLHVGDRLVGVLGSRQALRGFVGQAPMALCKNMRLALLNIGGVIGHYIDSTTALGDPAQVRYLGTVVDEQGIVSLNRTALPASNSILKWRPIVLVLGTCMHVGKTATAAKLIEIATQAGFKVGAAKVSGVGAIKDLNKFWEAGAVDVKSFLDCGLPSTVDAEDLASVVKTVINATQGDMVIIEFGDGILGHYKVESVLTDKKIMSHVSSVIVCAGDLMGAYGAKMYLDQMGISFAAFSGLATENVSGSDYLEEKLGIPAINGLKYPKRLFDTLNLTAGYGKSNLEPFAAPLRTIPKLFNGHHHSVGIKEAVVG
ncbi:MAG TPA: hypothetical protein PLB32_16685 [Acidobacteriota bacterium]|nr:hypothetical protein [Acidobacteriota bacterium]HNB73843.1 hypothetical protein [Acidobacteriota bacterium]HNG94444.1 hypothetical protein [Acidobacteriota bacterium]